MDLIGPIGRGGCGGGGGGGGLRLASGGRLLHVGAVAPRPISPSWPNHRSRDGVHAPGRVPTRDFFFIDEPLVTCTRTIDDYHIYAP